MDRSLVAMRMHTESGATAVPLMALADAGGLPLLRDKQEYGLAWNGRRRQWFWLLVFTVRRT